MAFFIVSSVSSNSVINNKIKCNALDYHFISLQIFEIGMQWASIYVNSDKYLTDILAISSLCDFRPSWITEYNECHIICEHKWFVSYTQITMTGVYI